MVAADKAAARRRVDAAASTSLGLLGRAAASPPAIRRTCRSAFTPEQALKKLGLWDAVSPRLARADDVRSALLLVERGEAPAGIVYATDAAAS